MSLPVAFRPEAEQELAQAKDWYEARREGLRGEFVRCVEAAISRAARGPESNACVLLAGARFGTQVQGRWWVSKG